MPTPRATTTPFPTLSLTDLATATGGKHAHHGHRKPLAGTDAELQTEPDNVPSHGPRLDPTGGLARTATSYRRPLKRP